MRRNDNAGRAEAHNTQHTTHNIDITNNNNNNMDIHFLLGLYTQACNNWK